METKFCEMCESAMKLIPAGVSKKTGRQYNAFWSCQNPDCKHTMNINQEAKPMKEPQWSEKILKVEENEQIKLSLKLINDNIKILMMELSEIKKLIK